MRIGIANDHAAVEMKKEIASYLESKGFEVVNYGTDDNASVDYPVYGEKVATAIRDEEVDLGVLICGPGIGISLAANKVPGIRAAVVSEPISARLSREHNNANIIAFGARIVGLEEAKGIVDAFFGAEFLGDRHARRVDMIDDVDKRNH